MLRGVGRCSGWIMAVLLILMLLVRTEAQPKLTALVVEEVATNSPAAKADLKVGDRIMSYDEKALVSPNALQAVEENTFGKKEVALQVRRAGQTLTLKVSPGNLGIKVRPELPAAALQPYEEGKVELHSRKVKEAIDRWEAAAKAAEVSGEPVAAGWLRGRIGEAYESQRQWKEAITARAAAWELLKQSSDLAGQSRMLVALGRSSQSLNDFTAAERWFEQAKSVDAAAGNETWVAADLNSLGNIFRLRGDLPVAEDYHS